MSRAPDIGESSGSESVPSLFAGLAGDAQVSFEFFPPKTEKMEQALWETMKTLEPLEPRFVSVTYGAGGSTRERTHATVARIVAETQAPAAAHLTCVDASRGEIDDVARAYWDAGVRHIVALRGDPSVPGARFSPHPEGYSCAADLVAGLQAVAPFEISVACYPETHPDAQSAEADLDNLKRKLDAGASRGITQFFFEPETFFRFRDRVAAAGINAELTPGIMPVTNFAAIQRMSALCGTQVPSWRPYQLKATARSTLASTRSHRSAKSLIVHRCAFGLSCQASGRLAVTGMRPVSSSFVRTCQWPKFGNETMARRPMRRRCSSTGRGRRVA
mgnify:CR=1 FL=1